jgi:hypothetical protein
MNMKIFNTLFLFVAIMFSEVTYCVSSNTFVDKSINCLTDQNVTIKISKYYNDRIWIIDCVLPDTASQFIRDMKDAIGEIQKSTIGLQCINGIALRGGMATPYVVIFPHDFLGKLLMPANQNAANADPIINALPGEVKQLLPNNGVAGCFAQLNIFFLLGGSRVVYPHIVPGATWNICSIFIDIADSNLRGGPGVCTSINLTTLPKTLSNAPGVAARLVGLVNIGYPFDALVFHEMNHAKHCLIGSRTLGIGHAPVGNAFGNNSSLGIVLVPAVPGGFMGDAEEELQLTGYTTIVTAAGVRIIRDVINEASYRRNRQYHLRFPYDVLPAATNITKLNVHTLVVNSGK